LYAVSNQATVHFWNVIELVNGVGNWGSAFQALTTGWTAGDANYGIGEPACTESVISVASHVSEYLTGIGTLAGGQISYFSSYGPLMNGTMKPDISAPGSSICSSISSFTSMSIPSMNVVETVYFNLRQYRFVRFSGTSMSSPHVTGVVALMLEANPWLTPAQIKQIIKETARQDDRTGVIPPEGSTRWGWGKVNALMAVYEAANFQNIEIKEPKEPLMIYPNPVYSKACFSGTFTSDVKVHVYNLNGSLTEVLNIQQGEDKCFSTEHYAVGTYLVFVYDGKEWNSAKFIKL
jgi:minor extracellular serine protease Vpr